VSMVNVSTMECNIPANVVKVLAAKNARLIRDLAQKIPAKTISNASMRVKITSASVNRDFQARIAKKMVVHAPLVIPAKMMEFAHIKEPNTAVLASPGSPDPTATMMFVLARLLQRRNRVCARTKENASTKGKSLIASADPVSRETHVR